MVVERQTPIHKSSQTTTAGDFGGQNESRATTASTNENAANILATMCRGWRAPACRFWELSLTQFSTLRVPLDYPRLHVAPRSRVRPTLGSAAALQLAGAVRSGCSTAYRITTPLRGWIRPTCTSNSTPRKNLGRGGQGWRPPDSQPERRSRRVRPYMRCIVSLV